MWSQQPELAKADSLSGRLDGVRGSAGSPCSCHPASSPPTVRAERRAREGLSPTNPLFITWSSTTGDLVPLTQTLSYYLLCPKRAFSLGSLECPEGPHPAQSPRGVTPHASIYPRQGAPKPPTAAVRRLPMDRSVSGLLASGLRSGRSRMPSHLRGTRASLLCHGGQESPLWGPGSLSS